MISNFVADWKARRASDALEKAEVRTRFDALVQETRPLTPKAKVYQDAALYRHTRKRAVVLEHIAITAGEEADMNLYRKFQEHASKAYFSVADEGPYGKVRLSMSDDASRKIWDHELVRIQYLSNPSSSRDSRGVVYLLKSGPNYKIGRTNDFGRRLNEIRLQLADPVTAKHIIHTDHPVRVERYWHKTFSYRRKRGEWFGLDDREVREFTKHDQM